METRQRRLAAAWMTAAVLLVATGCGQGATPVDQVPALAQTLDQVDDAIAAEKYDSARGSIDDLVDVTVEARDGGELESGEADRILAAAARLRSALPVAGSTSPTDPGTLPSPSPSPSPSESDEKDDNGNSKGKGKKDD